MSIGEKAYRVIARVAVRGRRRGSHAGEGLGGGSRQRRFPARLMVRQGQGSRSALRAVPLSLPFSLSSLLFFFFFCHSPLFSISKQCRHEKSV